jgi:hypothetical protein
MKSGTYIITTGGGVRRWYVDANGTWRALGNKAIRLKEAEEKWFPQLPSLLDLPYEELRKFRDSLRT